MKRRQFQFAATALPGKNLLGAAFAPATGHADGPLKIEAVELIELPRRNVWK